MKKLIQILLITFFCYCSFSQEFKIISIDISSFPEVSLLYEATDATVNIITNAEHSDFKIEENNKNYPPSEVINPKVGNAPVSAVLVVDNSGSMANGRLDMAKKGISIFLKTFPFETSELALESFSEDIIVNTDFTQNPDRVLFTLHSIEPLTGTNFNNAFLKTSYGAIELTERAINKSIIVFITDGLSSARAKEIGINAISSGIQVHCVLMELNSPKDLKEISLMTGGTTTESIKDEVKLANTLTSIIQKSQISRYGTLKWISDNNCNVNRNLKISFRNIPVTTNYVVPQDKIANLEVNPTTVYFGTVHPGYDKDAELEIIPHRGIFNVTGLSISKPELFALTSKTLVNETLFPDSVFKVNIRYTSTDMIQVSDYLRISTKECPDKTVKLLAGSEEQIQIISPSGGEIFVPGMDTSVQWDGVPRKRNVVISFRTSPDKEWTTIGNGSKWLYKWLIHNEPSQKCQVKLSSEPSGLFELKPLWAFGYQGFNIKSAQFNSDGSYLVSNDDHGYVVVWNTQNGGKERVYGGFKFENATFYDQNNTLVLFNKEKITLIKNSKNINPSNYSFSGKKVYTSICFDNGNEELISAYIISDKAGLMRIWMPGTSKVFFLDGKQNTTSASFAPSINCVVTCDENSQLRSWDTKIKQTVASYSAPGWFTKAVIGNSASIVAVTGKNNIHMLSLPEMKVFWKRNDLNYIKFSQSGLQLIARDTSGRYCFVDCMDGKTLFSFHDYTFYQCSPSNKQIVIFSNDTLKLFDANKKSNILKFVDPEIKDCRFSPNGKKILVINGKNEIDIYDAGNGELDETISDINVQANSAVFSPDDKSIAVILSNGIIQLFEKVSIKSGKDAISNTFSIVKPKPEIADKINFGDRVINQNHELMVSPFAKNNTKFPIRLLRMEICNDNKKVFANHTTQFPIVLDSMQSLDCEFTFSPIETGRQQAYLKTYTSTDTFTTLIEGNGLNNPLHVSNFEIDFGKVRLYSVKDTLVEVLINKGTDTIDIESIRNAGPDTVQFKLSRTDKKIRIAPNQGLLCNIKFAPKYRGLTTGYINVLIKSIPDPQRIRLSGDGFAPRLIVVKGIVRNVLDSMPLVANLVCNDLQSNKAIISTHTDSTGRYNLTLNSDRNYSLVALKNNFLSSSENVDLSEQIIADTVYADLWLAQIRSGGVIKFNCIFFDFAKSTIKDISKNDLNRIAQMLSENKSITIEIHGHTDYIGSDADNMILSGQRAQAVKSYIIQRGISATRLRTIAHGERMPVVDNNTAEGRKANRRVEFKIMSGSVIEKK